MKSGLSGQSILVKVVTVVVGGHVFPIGYIRLIIQYGQLKSKRFGSKHNISAQIFCPEIYLMLLHSNEKT